MTQLLKAFNKTGQIINLSNLFSIKDSLANNFNSMDSDLITFGSCQATIKLLIVQTVQVKVYLF
jgi:hypothetical protein